MIEPHMTFVSKITTLYRLRNVSGAVAILLFMGMFFFDAERRILAIVSLLFIIVGIMSQIVMAYLLHNASASDRKLGKAAGLYKYI